MGADPAEFEPHRVPGTPNVDAPRFRADLNHLLDPDPSLSCSEEFWSTMLAGWDGPSAKTGVVWKCSNGILI